MDYRYNGQSLLGRILIWIVTIAVIVGAAFFILPIALGVILVMLVVGLVISAWVWWQLRKGAASATYYESRTEVNQGATLDKGPTEEEFVDVPGDGRPVETADKKRWRMNDVEDVEDIAEKK